LTEIVIVKSVKKVLVLMVLLIVQVWVIGLCMGSMFFVIWRTREYVFASGHDWWQTSLLIVCDILLLFTAWAFLVMAWGFRKVVVNFYSANFGNRAPE